MKVWLTTFGLLFVLAQMYVWVKDFILPLPVYILGGAFLAIASNYESGIFSFFPKKFQHQNNETESVMSQTATLVENLENFPNKSSIDKSLPFK
jgi:hypothetical protein